MAMAVSPAPQSAIEVRYRPLVVAANLLVLALGSTLVFGNNRLLTYFGYDGAFYRTLLRNQQQWQTPHLHLGADPLEGLGNQFFLINTRFIPSDFIAALASDNESSAVLSYTIVATELFAAVVFVAWSYRLAPQVGLVGAWLATLASLPYTFPGLLYPLSRGAPQRFEHVAVAVVIVALYHRLGQAARWRSVLETTILCLLTLWLFVSVLLGMTMFPTLAVAFATELIAARGKERAVKLCGLLAIVLSCLPTALPYLIGTCLYTVPRFFLSELQRQPESLRTISVLFQFNFSDGYFGPILVLGGAAGAGLAWRRAAPGPRRVLLLGLIVDGLLIVTGIVAIYGLPHYAGPSPVYFEVAVWPLLSLGLAYLVLTIVRSVVPLMLVPLLLSPLLFDDFRQTVPIFPYPPTLTPLVQELQQEIALELGGKFRGSVATFTCRLPPGGTWADVYEIEAHTSVSTGNEHRSFGLWYFNIPTLHEYNQFMTPPYYLMTTRMLARPEDVQRRSVVVLTRPNIPYLRSLGVRYMITDQERTDSGLRLQERMRVDEQQTLWLYELPRPNLASFSPTKVHVVPSASQTLERLRQDDFNYEAEAVVTQPLFEERAEQPLLPVTRSELRIHRDHFEIEAASEGTSLLLLPLQYSHCLQLTTTGPALAQLVRTNLMQAGLLFSHKVHVEIRFMHGPFTNPYGRLADYAEAKALRLVEGSNRRQHSERQLGP